MKGETKRFGAPALASWSNPTLSATAHSARHYAGWQ